MGWVGFLTPWTQPMGWVVDTWVINPRTHCAAYSILSLAIEAYCRMSRKFNPSLDIPDLIGKTILITGGDDYITFALIIF